MAYTLSIEDVLVYGVCSRRYILEQSLLFIDSGGKRGLPCIIKAKIGGEISFVDGEKVTIGGRNIYAYDPSHIAWWLKKRKSRYEAARKNFKDTEAIVEVFIKEMEDISNAKP
jgi:hypothetical protein